MAGKKKANNASKGKQQPKKKASGGRKTRKSSGYAPLSMVMQSCSITNPFCEEANSGRWPDNSYTKTNVYTIKKAIDVTADAAGKGITMFVGDLYNYMLPSNTAAFPTCTMTGTLVNLLGGLPSATRYRLTSWGLRISCPYVAPTTAAGVVSVRLFSPLTGSTLTTIDATSTMCDNSMDISVASLMTKPLLIIPLPLGDNARLFRDVADATTVSSVWKNPGWQVVTVAVSGPVISTALVRCECFYHYELVPADGDSTYNYALAPPRDNPMARRANSNILADVGNFVEGGFEKIDRLVQSKAAKYLGAAAATFFGGPAAGASAYGGMAMLEDRSRARIVD